MSFSLAAKAVGPVVNLRTIPAANAPLVASTHVADAIIDAIRERGCARLAIAGGSAMAPLAPLRERLGEAWKQVKLCWLDERCVDFDHPDSNRGSAYRTGALDKKHSCMFEMPGWLDSDTPKLACERIKSTLLSEFDNELDVLLLGMGGDGHIASLFPGHAATVSTGPDLVAYISDSPKPPARRITLTMRILSSAQSAILVALGESKQDALSRLVAGDSALPASRLSNLVILTDQNLLTDREIK
ncbi:MAG: 6-phosphogluconolactonase [Kofleriaceae bacterium]|nr:6-phosphogluconolactonase [Kofleriaceae bacterium]